MIDFYLKGIRMFICSAYLQSVSQGAFIFTNIMSLFVNEGWKKKRKLFRLFKKPFVVVVFVSFWIRFFFMSVFLHYLRPQQKNQLFIMLVLCQMPFLSIYLSLGLAQWAAVAQMVECLITGSLAVQDRAPTGSCCRYVLGQDTPCLQCLRVLVYKWVCEWVSGSSM